MNFNEKLINLRKTKGLSQEELGEELKVSHRPRHDESRHHRPRHDESRHYGPGYDRSWHNSPGNAHGT